MSRRAAVKQSIDDVTTSIKEMRIHAEKKGIDPRGMSKTTLRNAIMRASGQSPKIKRYRTVKSLGRKGKEGSVFEVKLRGKSYAKKQFRKSKSAAKIEKEVAMQKIGTKAGISPIIREFNLNDKYIIMQKLEKNLYDVMQRRGGTMAKVHQRALLRIFRKLDKVMVFHKDPNPVNFMFTSDNVLKIIDYGFAEEINVRKHGLKPNREQMTLGLLLKFKKLFPGVEYEILENSLPIHLQEILNR